MLPYHVVGIVKLSESFPEIKTTTNRCLSWRWGKYDYFEDEINHGLYHFVLGLDSELDLEELRKWVFDILEEYFGPDKSIEVRVGLNPFRNKPIEPSEFRYEAGYYGVSRDEPSFFL